MVICEDDTFIKGSSMNIRWLDEIRWLIILVLTYFEYNLEHSSVKSVYFSSDDIFLSVICRSASSVDVSTTSLTSFQILAALYTMFEMFLRDVDSRGVVQYKGQQYEDNMTGYKSLVNNSRSNTVWNIIWNYVKNCLLVLFQPFIDLQDSFV